MSLCVLGVLMVNDICCGSGENRAAAAADHSLVLAVFAPQWLRFSRLLPATSRNLAAFLVFAAGQVGENPAKRDNFRNTFNVLCK
jgi:hypothetical protein